MMRADLPQVRGMTRRKWLGGAATAVLLPGLNIVPVLAQPGIFRPEDFGAVGDGVANDTLAFALMSDAVNRAGGGRIELRRTTYVVGRQVRNNASGRYGWTPSPLLALVGCRRPLTIAGNGARLRCAAGLRFGSFDPRTQRPIHPAMPFYGDGVLATPYEAMVLVQGCTGGVAISDLELDGNAASLQIGGTWGDTGWQIPAYGLRLVDNTGAEVVERVFSHDHALDGIIIDGAVGATPARRVFTGVRADRNGRQGCSLVGGRGYRFVDCSFGRTGRGLLSSSPAAGFDIEAEGGKTVRDIAFARCAFVDNAGCGLVADSGDTADVRFDDCRFVGTTNYAAWPNKPGFRFSRCTFVGASSNCFGGPPAQAAQFQDCIFTDVPAAGSRGLVYLHGASGPIVDLSNRKNVRFERCRFLLAGRGVLPWSTDAIYVDCVMTQRLAEPGYPRGTYLGRTSITAPRTGLDGARIVGQLLVNGAARTR